MLGVLASRPFSNISSIKFPGELKELQLLKVDQNRLVQLTEAIGG